MKKIISISVFILAVLTFPQTGSGQNQGGNETLPPSSNLVTKALGVPVIKVTPDEITHEGGSILNINQLDGGDIRFRFSGEILHTIQSTGRVLFSHPNGEANNILTNEDGQFVIQPNGILASDPAMIIDDGTLNLGVGTAPDANFFVPGVRAMLPGNYPLSSLSASSTRISFNRFNTGKNETIEAIPRVNGISISNLLPLGNPWIAKYRALRKVIAARTVKLML